MSLVGSLEDLGLTDILQIVSLARKSGRLLLRSGPDAGRIVLCDGLVRGAAVKGEDQDLRALLVDGGFVAPEAFERASDHAGREGTSLRDAIVATGGLPQERLDALRREAVERAIMRMFLWRSGEFSFEVREQTDPEDADLLLSRGINTQYLAMEAMRLGDEGGRLDAALDVDEEPVFSGETSVGEGSDPERAAVDAIALAAARAEVDTEERVGAGPSQLLSDAGIAQRPPRVAEIRVEVDAPAPIEVSVSVSEPSPVSRPVVAMDLDLSALEWLKDAADSRVPRVHIFQRVDLAVERIRQYLARGIVPLVVAGPALMQRSPDPTLLARLRGVAPGIQIVAFLEPGESGSLPLGYDGALTRPSGLSGESEPRADRGAEARALADALADFARGAARADAPGASFRASLDRLRDVSERMRDPTRRHDVLALVLDFAAEQFSRVAVFMIRDQVAVCMAQRGFGREGLVGSGLELPIRDLPEPFGRALEDRRGAVGRVSPAGDGAFARWFGRVQPREGYVGPIESGGCVVALVYADHLPSDRAIGDTAALEVGLHEAGLALERALLARALADPETRT